MEKHNNKNKTTVSHIWKITSTEYFFNLSERLSSPLFIENCENSILHYKICMDCDREFYECLKCLKSCCKNVQVNMIFLQCLPENLIIDIEYKIREVVKKVSISETAIDTNRECEIQEFSICKHCEEELNLKCLLTFDAMVDKQDKNDITTDSDQRVTSTNWENNLINYLSMIYMSGKFSDMAINVSGTVFKIHAAVLSHYTYFKSLIIKAMSEGQGQIDLNDIKPEIFDRILYYIYTGDELSIKNHAYALIIPAHQLHIDDLVENCAKILQMEININNAIDICIAAHKAEAYELYLNAKRYIRNNITEIKKSMSYEGIKLNDINLLKEILDGLLEY